MSNQLSIIVCVVFGIISWYYFNKFRESENEYTKLHKRFEQSYTENQKMKSRIKDLQTYKNDVSKTFKILDNELLLINDHLKRQSNIRESTSVPMTPMTPMNSMNSMNPINHMSPMNIGLSRISSFTSLPSGNNVSLLTPELLTSLFNMNTLDTLTAGLSSEQGSLHAQQQTQQQEQPQSQEVEQPPMQSVTEEVIQQEVQSEESDKLDLQIDIDKIGLGDVLSGNGDNYEKYIM